MAGTRRAGVSRPSSDVTGLNSRTCSVYWKGGYVPAGSTEGDAVAKQAELRQAQARGERVVLAHKAPLVSEFAEVWFNAKSGRLRTATVKDYRASLDLVLLPRFGAWRLSAIDADAIAKLVRRPRGKKA